jgi:uncharacterized protein (TIGR00251 family)
VDVPSAKASGGGVIFEVHVTPSAKEDSISYSGGVLRVRTTKPADKGKANKAVTKLLKRVFGPCEITRGHLSRRKTAYVENTGLDEFNRLLGGLEGGG